MLIVRCRCGQELRIAPEQVGAEVRCPACGEVTVVAASAMDALAAQTDRRSRPLERELADRPHRPVWPDRPDACRTGRRLAELAGADPQGDADARRRRERTERILMGTAPVRRRPTPTQSVPTHHARGGQSGAPSVQAHRGNGAGGYGSLRAGWQRVQPLGFTIPPPSLAPLVWCPAESRRTRPAIGRGLGQFPPDWTLNRLGR